jgi:hypothetical protein
LHPSYGEIGFGRDGGRRLIGADGQLYARMTLT